MLLKKIVTQLKKIILHPQFRAYYIFAFFYKYSKPKTGKIVVESFSGTNIFGQPYYLLKEANERMEEFQLSKMYVASKKDKRSAIRTFLKKNSLKNYQVVSINSIRYCWALATAEILINNSTFPKYFLKKDSQVYINTWHGTPLKRMGRSLPNPLESLNVQRNLIMADLTPVNSDYMFDIFQNDYLLSLKNDKHMPRIGNCANSIFFKPSNDIKSRYGLEGKTIIAFMPTWRGDLYNRDYSIVDEYNQLYAKFVDTFGQDVKFFIKTHQLINNAETEQFLQFPSDIETYEFLNVVDVLITDYSSVMFDFSHRDKPIILYLHDLEEYRDSRGLYIPNFRETFPFEIAYTEDELLKKVGNSLKSNSNVDYAKFRELYCTYYSLDANDKVWKAINKIRFGRNSFIQSQTSKKRMLIYGGSLALNGITTSLLSLINAIDKEKYDVYLFFYSTLSKKEKVKYCLEAVGDIKYFAVERRMLVTPLESLILYLSKQSSYLFRIFSKNRQLCYARQYRKAFHSLSFNILIHYSGYEADIKQLFTAPETNQDAQKILYVHNDLFSEKKTKNNINFTYHEAALHSFSKIALVNEHLRAAIEEKYTFLDKRVFTVPNLFDVERYKKEPNYAPLDRLDNPELANILLDEEIFKFVTIGRYSVEKGHIRLIEAFEHVCKHHTKSILVIIGGHGNLYNETLARVQKSRVASKIFLLKGLYNPHYYLKYMNGFVLSSFYEGIPVVLFEALFYNLPIVTTNIPGPSDLINGRYGEVVENSIEGLVIGMQHLIQGSVEHQAFDFDVFNKTTYERFERMIEHNTMDDH